jgi:hypothetical protein
MSAQALLMNVVGVIVTALLLFALRWAAIERGRIHRAWTRLRHQARWKAGQSLDWCMAMAATAGWA